MGCLLVVAVPFALLVCYAIHLEVEWHRDQREFGREYKEKFGDNAWKGHQ